MCRGKYRIPFFLTDSTLPYVSTFLLICMFLSIDCEKLLKKFLVRDPVKRASLEILIDDPWINESYNDSPVSTDKSEKVEEDESIIKIMEVKYKFERNAILQALRENIYNDISAIYFLFYYDKDTKSSIEQNPGASDITKITNPNPKKESMTAGEKEKAMPKIGEDEVLVEEDDGQIKATLSVPTDAASRSHSTGAKKGLPVTSAAPSATAAGPGEAPVASGRRKRAATVTHEFEAATSNFTAPIATGHTATQSEKPKLAINGAPVDRPSTAAVVGDKKATDQGDQSPEASSANTAQAPRDSSTGIKRNNTITGIIRGLSQRRASELPDHHAGAGEAEDGSDKPRSLRFTFNSNTTSSKSPDEIMVELVKASNKLSLAHRLITRYLIECASTSTTAGKDALKIEVEVCKLPRLNNLHGLRFKRVSGSSADYKEVCEQILASINL